MSRSKGEYIKPSTKGFAQSARGISRAFPFSTLYTRGEAGSFLSMKSAAHAGAASGDFFVKILTRVVSNPSGVFEPKISPNARVSSPRRGRWAMENSMQ